MARFLLAWELGGGFGHLGNLARLAEGLRAGGHEVSFALRDLSKTAALGELRDQTRGSLFQAPLWLAPARGLPGTLAGHAEILLHFGYGAPDRLWGLIEGWRTLFETCRPELVICENAPTALLAARCAGLNCVQLGSGFSCPPAALSPLPAFRPLEPGMLSRAGASERMVLASANRLLARAGKPQLKHLAELFRTPLGIFPYLPMFDLYARHRDDTWLSGPFPPASQGASPAWPDRAAPRVLGYLRMGSVHTERVVESLRMLPVSAIVHVGDAREDWIARHRTEHLHIVTRPVDFDLALAEADAFISYANLGSMSEAVRHGTPVVTLPMTLEQELHAEMAHGHGLGVAGAAPDSTDAVTPERFAERLTEVLDDPGYAARAREIAAEFPRPAIERMVARTIARLESLIANTPSR